MAQGSTGSGELRFLSSVGHDDCEKEWRGHEAVPGIASGVTI